MKKTFKILIVVAILFAILQLPFFQPTKNYSDTKPTEDIYTIYDIPMDVQMHFNNSCYDCHSNYTEEYPWYYNLQPVSWWMNSHIKKAKKHLNFSEFAAYSKEEQIHHFKEIQEVMEEQVMPLKSYLLMHDEAEMNDREYKKVADWAKKMASELEESSN